MQEKLKNAFINEEIWILTFGGAFQRSGIYENIDLNDPRRTLFRNDIKYYIETNILPQYCDQTVEEEKHIKNLLNFSEWSKKYSEIIKGGYLKLGISQKLINLYLKYQWCLGNIQEPPHCPFDRIIIQKLGYNPIPSWTKLENEKEYRELVSKSKAIANASNKSIAEWELSVFERR